MNSTPPGDWRFISPPDDGPAEEAAMPYAPTGDAADAPTSAGERARHALEQRLQGDAAVTAIIRDRDASGEDIFLVYVRDPAATARIPATIDGVRVVVRVGEFDAYPGPQVGA